MYRLDKNHNSSALSAPEFCHERYSHLGMSLVCAGQLSPKQTEVKKEAFKLLLSFSSFLECLVRPALIFLNVDCVVQCLRSL